MTFSIEQAIEKYEAFVRSNPKDGAAVHDLSVLYSQSGQIEKALSAAREASEISPESAEVWLHLGNLEARQRNTTEAVNAFRRASKIAAMDPRGWFNLGNLLAQRNQRAEAISALEQARTLSPGNPQILASLALAYRKHGLISDAIKHYKTARDNDPGDSNIQSNLLVAMQYLPGINDQKLYESHKQWDTQFAHPQTSSLPSIKDGKTPLRVGYVSGDFHAHPIGYFLLGVLRNHDAEVVTPICLSDTVDEDILTRDLKHNTAEWIETRQMDDVNFAECVSHNAIDILVDLSGHLKHNRLSVFAQRAAPIQVTWAGYVGTTGLTAMDWLVSDKNHTPDGFEKWSSEKVARLPHDYICYSPPEYAPAVTGLPYDQNRLVTFGCFNNLVKVNDAVLQAWAAILSRVPGSRLLLKCADLSQPDLRDRILRIMSGHEVDTKRIELREKSPHYELLNSYGEVDIALDTFPYSGGLTTLEALWMGVPVVTKIGESFAGRHSTSHLRTVGLEEWVADDVDGYVALACNKAGDTDALRRLRASLRKSVANSPVCNVVEFTKNLEILYQTVWHQTYLERTGSGRSRVLDIS